MTPTREKTQVQIHGPLHDHAEGFEAELLRLGFTPTSRMSQFYLLAHLSRWLELEGASLGDMTSTHGRGEMHGYPSIACRWCRQRK